MQGPEAGLRCVCGRVKDSIIEQKVRPAEGLRARRRRGSHALHLKLAPPDFSVGTKGRVELRDRGPRKAPQPSGKMFGAGWDVVERKHTTGSCSASVWLCDSMQVT